MSIWVFQSLLVEEVESMKVTRRNGRIEVLFIAAEVKEEKVNRSVAAARMTSDSIKEKEEDAIFSFITVWEKMDFY